MSSNKDLLYERIDYLCSHLKEYRGILREQSIRHANDAGLFARVAAIEKKEYRASSMCFVGFDNLDRIVADVRMAADFVQPVEEFLEEVSKLSLEELFTSNEPNMRKLGKLIISLRSRDEVLSEEG